MVALLVEVLEKFLARLLLNQREGLRQFPHVDCWFAAVDRVGSDVGVGTHNGVVQNDCVVADHRPLSQNAVSAYFDVVADRHGLNYGPPVHEDVVACITDGLPIEMGTYLSYLFWRFVGGLRITISDRTTYLPMLTLARSPLRMMRCCRMA